MQQLGLAQARASNITAGQHDCVHQQTSPGQLKWAGSQEDRFSGGGEGISVRCSSQQARCGFLVPESVVC